MSNQSQSKGVKIGVVGSGRQSIVQEIIRITQETIDRREEESMNIHKAKSFGDQNNYRQPKPFYTPFIEVDQGEKARFILSQYKEKPRP